MSAVGHKRTLQGASRTYALPSKADMVTIGIDVR
jgi:hypothetical protein